VLYSACRGAVKLHYPRLAGLCQAKSFIHDVKKHSVHGIIRARKLFGGRQGKSLRVIMASWRKWMVETDGIEPTT
jgi:hypothetical protein